MDRWLNGAGRLIEALLVVLMAVMVVLVFGNVVLRYAMNSGITMSEELARWCFVWVTFLGAALGLKENAHLGTDMLTDRLGPKGKRISRLITLALMVVCTVLIFQGSLAQARINWDVEAPVSGLSMAWVYGVGVVFAVLTLPLLLLEAVRAWRGQLPGAAAESLIP